MTPFRVAFNSDDIEDDKAMFIARMYSCFDMCFLLDIVLTFLSTYNDQENVEVTDLKQIAINYLKSWFFIDCFSIFPFEQVITMGNFN
jgi:hypothetical protein